MAGLTDAECEELRTKAETLFKSFFEDEAHRLDWEISFGNLVSRAEKHTIDGDKISVGIFVEDKENDMLSHSHDDAPAVLYCELTGEWNVEWRRHEKKHRLDKSGFSQPAVIVHKADGEVIYEFWKNGLPLKPDAVKINPTLEVISLEVCPDEEGDDDWTVYKYHTNPVNAA